MWWLLLPDPGPDVLNVVFAPLMKLSLSVTAVDRVAAAAVLLLSGSFFSCCFFLLQQQQRAAMIAAKVVGQRQKMRRRISTTRIRMVTGMVMARTCEVGMASRNEKKKKQILSKY